MVSAFSILLVIILGLLLYIEEKNFQAKKLLKKRGYTLGRRMRVLKNDGVTCEFAIVDAFWNGKDFIWKTVFYPEERVENMKSDDLFFMILESKLYDFNKSE